MTRVVPWRACRLLVWWPIRSPLRKDSLNDLWHPNKHIAAEYPAVPIHAKRLFSSSSVKVSPTRKRAAAVSVWDEELIIVPESRPKTYRRCPNRHKGEKAVQLSIQVD